MGSVGRCNLDLCLKPDKLYVLSARCSVDKKVKHVFIDLP